MLDSIKRFDWCLSCCLRLFAHIHFDSLQGGNVFEAVLGYGAVSQRLAETGANYTGIDIAKGPVEMVNHRLG